MRKGEGAVLIHGDNPRVTLRCVFDRDMRSRNASASNARNSAGQVASATWAFS